MNNNYIYVDGKVIVNDENGNKKPVEYYDNIDEVLIQENLVETMEKEIKKLERKSEQYKKYNKGRYFPLTLPVMLIFSIIVPLFLYWISDGIALTASTNTAFGPMNSLIAMSISLLFGPLLMSCALEFISYRGYKIRIREEKGINSELEFLKKQIELEREHLESLKQEKTRDNENTEFRTVEVDDKQRLRELEGISNLYFNLGYYDKKYYKLYRQGRLEKKLGQYYNEDEINLAKEYLEEKGPVLAKRNKIKL